MRILLAQINPTVGDLKGNEQKIAEAIAFGKENQADIVVFPELSITGYPPEDLLLFNAFIQESKRVLERIIAKTKGIAAIVGFPRQNPNQKEKGLLNSVAVIDDGNILGYHDKILLPTYDVFDEKRYFDHGETVHLFEIKGKKIAVTICEDIWQQSGFLSSVNYKKNPVEELIPFKPDLLLNLSASPFSPSNYQRRFDVTKKASQVLDCPVFLCNQVGGNDSLIFDGHSHGVSSKGSFFAIAKGFEEDFCLVDLDKKRIDQSFSFDSSKLLYQALTLGIKDYFKKQNFSKACVGLSGGIDSALVLCLAVDALGPENVLAVMMPSRYSSEHSKTDAMQLIQNLGVSYKMLSIETPFQAYLDLLSPHFEGRKADVTEENLQARIRGTLLMALSNKFGFIVLSTGNKSEMAMGYSTLYGDTCGGLSVISDLMKTQVYEIARWINRDKEVIPENILIKPPSAELRENQKDSDTLPPYEVIDPIIKEYVEGHVTPYQIAKKYHFPLPVVEEIVKKIHQSEYKRRQNPPGLRVSEKSFSVGRRFPIVQKWV